MYVYSKKKRNFYEMNLYIYVSDDWIHITIRRYLYSIANRQIRILVRISNRILFCCLNRNYGIPLLIDQ